MDTQGNNAPAWRTVRTAAVLAVAATLAVGLVAVVNDHARPQIEASLRAEQLRQLTAVLGDIAYDNDPLTDTLLVSDPEYLGTAEPLAAHRVRRNGEPIAVLLNTVAPDGYAGALRLLVAIDVEGRLIGVRVLEHGETPGLGDFVEERRTDWIRQFDGRSLDGPPPARWPAGRCARTAATSTSTPAPRSPRGP